ncbi:phosphatase PAP2 family protein [Chromohalobacter salexigens]|nr:phosphatase PAP2 family protein [Chromohalobacter salexigens]
MLPRTFLKYSESPWVPLLKMWVLFTLLIIAIAYFELDFRTADAVYTMEGGDWTLSDFWLTKYVLHDIGERFSISIGVVVLVAIVATFFVGAMKSLRRPLVYLFVSVALSALIVSLIKNSVNVACPWDLVRYGGNIPYVGFFQEWPSKFPDIACFPAGHASAGYAWIALYFFFDYLFVSWIHRITAALWTARWRQEGQRRYPSRLTDQSDAEHGIPTADPDPTIPDPRPL